jgi:hypothetical protein
MWWRFICIEGLSRTPLLMKIRSKNPTAGVVTPLVDRRAWQVISQWVWNLRLELGHQLHPDPVRTTSIAPACPPVLEEANLCTSPLQGYGPAAVALRRTR